jgi:hypothetical protein
MATKEAQSLREQYPNAWIPVEEGDKLQGTVMEVVRAWSDARNQGAGDGWYPLIRVQTTDGQTLDFHAFSAVGYNAVMEKQPVPGEQITVTYKGVSSKAKPGQNPAKLFHIHITGRDSVAEANSVYGRIGDGHVLAQAREAMNTATNQVEEVFPDTQTDFDY